MTISITSILRTAAASLLLFGMAQAATAGGESGLHLWKERASAQISEEMRYPTLLPRRTLPTAHTVVTARIARSGKVLEAELTHPSGIRKFDDESRDFTRRLQALPALPEAFEGNGAEVRMHLIYANNKREALRETRSIVRMQELADSEGSGNDDAKDGKQVTGLPVIELFGSAD